MIEEEIIKLITNVGFPIAVTLWFMFRVEKIIRDNTNVILSLKDMIEELCKNGRAKN